MKFFKKSTKAYPIRKLLIFFQIKLGFSNYVIKDLQLRNKTYKKLSKKYSNHTVNNHNNQMVGTLTEKKIIWVCWFQGFSNAPEIVKQCLKSINKYSGEFNVIEIDAQNFGEYVNIPNSIIDKWKKGIISNTHFSDILRMELLLQNGGLWIDATVLLTGEIPSYVADSDFFCYKHEGRRDITIVFESWFIYSKPNNIFLREVRSMIYDYWSKNNKLNDYFLFHLLFTIAVNRNKEAWDAIPFYSDITNHILHNRLTEPFNDNVFEHTTLQTNVHKLTYKYNIKSNDNIFRYIDFIMGENYE